MAKETRTKPVSKTAKPGKKNEKAPYFVDRQLMTGESAVETGKLLFAKDVVVEKYEIKRNEKKIKLSIEITIPADKIYNETLVSKVPYIAVSDKTELNVAQKNIMVLFDNIDGDPVFTIKYLIGHGIKVQHGN